MIAAANKLGIGLVFLRTETLQPLDSFESKAVINKIYQAVIIQIINWDHILGPVLCTRFATEEALGQKNPFTRSIKIGSRDPKFFLPNCYFKRFGLDG